MARRPTVTEAMTTDLFFGALRHDRRVVLTSLGVVVLLAWIYLLLGAGIEMEMMDMGGGQMMAMRPDWNLAYAAILFVMWVVMMLAMMLPSAAPVTLLVAGIVRKRTAAGAAVGSITALFVLGYLAVWVGFAAAATALQWTLEQGGQLSDTMALGNAMLAGVVLVAAGLYQWTPLKTACLRHCRSPLDFLLFHWRDGALGAFGSGMRHGAFCAGCCWMLMVLLFVGGVMSLAWIGTIALLVLLEKSLPWGGRMSRLTGAVLVLWGALTLVAAV